MQQRQQCLSKILLTGLVGALLTIHTFLPCSLRVWTLMMQHPWSQPSRA